MSGTSIEWTDATWNPVRGCTRVSPGCENCYAERQAARFRGPGGAYEGLVRTHANGEPRWTGEIKLLPELLDQPLRWRRPRRIFVNSMSDLFHDGIPDEFIDRVFAVMDVASHHTFQILTKRPARMLEYLTDPRLSGRILALHYEALGIRSPTGRKALADDWTLPIRNCWFGVSVENQETADERIPLLLDTPAAIRFLSVEPLLDRVSLTDLRGVGFDALYGVDHGRRKINWVIVGGESGPRARPCDVAWIRSIVAECKAAGCPVFVKQLGRRPLIRYGDWRSISVAHEWTGLRALNQEEKARPIDPEEMGHMRPIDSKGGEPLGWPEDIRVREFPS